MKKTLKMFNIMLAAVVMTCCALFCHVEQREAPQITYAESEQNNLDDAAAIAAKAGEIATKAMSALFGDDEGAISASSVFKSVFAGMGYVNCAVSFLKLIGVMKDGTAEALAKIQEQLTLITEKLEEMDVKLNTIIDKMSQISSEQKFIDRQTAARDYRKYFDDFTKDYETNGLDPLVSQFTGFQRDSIKDWYNATASSQRTGEIDNSYVTLIYDVRLDENNQPVRDKEGNLIYDLRYTTENGVPTGYEGRYLKLSADFLPLKTDDIPTWNIDTYADVIKSYIANKILKNFTQIESQNYTAFTPSGVYPDGILTPEIIAQTAEDAFNVIVFRTTAAKVNESSQFALSVKEKFNNYVTKLLKYENGFDAIVRSLYYTHSFEFEISDTIEELYNEFVVHTAYYGSFVKDVLAMSNAISQQERDSFDESLCNTLINLEKAKNAALTGHPNYCYLTNTLLYYGTTEMTASGTVKTFVDGWNDGYDGYTANGFSVTNYRHNADGTEKKYNKNYLIGNDNASLVSMTLRANGISANHDWFVSKFSANAGDNTNWGSLIVAVGDDDNLPTNSSFPLTTYKLIGDYFTHGGTVRLGSLPSGLDSSYIQYHRQVQGSVFNFASGALSTNQTIAAFAIFGESHWTWTDDESAFLYGQVPGRVSYAYSKVCTKDSGKKKYDNNFVATFTYNTILQDVLEPEPSLSEGGINSLIAFRSENNYTDPTAASETEPEKYSSPERDGNKGGLMATILVPSIVGGLAICGIITLCIVRTKHKKKRV